MSKLYTLYKDLKNKDTETIYLFKSGLFMIALDKDANFLSSKFNFKLTKFNDYIVKCGFPVSSMDKYLKIFSNNNIEFKIIDTQKNTSYSVNDYKLASNVQEILKRISAVDTENLSVKEAYNFIEQLKKLASYK